MVNIDSTDIISSSSSNMEGGGNGGGSGAPAGDSLGGCCSDKTCNSGPPKPTKSRCASKVVVINDVPSSCCGSNSNTSNNDNKEGGGCCSSKSTSSAATAPTDNCFKIKATDVGGYCPLPPSSSCCDHNKKDSIKTLTCLAVIRPDNSAVDVFDTKGVSKTFRFNAERIRIINRKNKDGSKNKLCFSNHGATGEIDGMITPCFDANGCHNDKLLKGCPCETDEAHLHAHVYNSNVCGVLNSVAVGNAGCGGMLQKKADILNGLFEKTGRFQFLSKLTLRKEDDDGEDNGGGGGGKLVGASMPINEHTPKECNSGALQSHLKERGLNLSHWLHWRNGGELNHGTCDENTYCGTAHRLYLVRHVDHTDFLIHNETTGTLHLEHPNCANCGENDIHGRFQLVHTRSWLGGEHKNTRINLHFFKVHDEPFTLLDVISGLFELESSRVRVARAAVGENDEKTLGSKRVGRSQFHVKGICCASEIPLVQGILRPIDGVVEMSVNPTTKMVYVDHDVDFVSADVIANALNNQGFGATCKKDAVVAMDQSMSGIPTDVFVHSTFDLSSGSFATVADRGKIGDLIQACLAQKFTDDEQLKNVSMNAQTMTLAVDHNPYYLTAPGIAKWLDEYMYEAKILLDGGADGKWALSSIPSTEETIEQHKSTVRWSVVLSGVLWIISMLSFVGENWDYLKYVALLSVAFGLPPIAIKAFRTLQRCRFDVNCMMLFAVLGALPLQEYTEAAAVTFLFAISEALEQRATARARNALSDIVCLRPEYANVINPVTKDIVVLPANSVAVGTTVSVRPGDKIPCDGTVIEGKSTIDESSLTGESRPVNKGVGNPVSGGTINTGNTQLVIKTTATSNNSAIARLIGLIEEAQSNRSETEQMVDSFAQIYTPIVILAAFCMVTIPWAFGNETGKKWAKMGLITIVIACPCALIISTPVTYVAGLAAIAQKGVICKGGQHLESLGAVKSIYFDKTGTLSQGVFALLHFNVVGETRSRKEVLGYLALMEAPASHPLSDAIVKGAANEQVDIPQLQLQNHTLLPGEGIRAQVDGKDVHVGNNKLFQRLGLYESLPEDVRATTEAWANAGGTTGFISIDNDIVGAYCVADKIRDETKDVVAALKKMGIEVTMLTGDQRPAAVGIGDQVGLKSNDIRSELLPEDKLLEIGNKVKENKRNKNWLSTNKAVMMVGDGVNDAPALALADVSVAMGEGAALAMDTADVTLMDSNLTKLLYIIRMGKRVRRTIFENVAFSLIVKAVVFGFTFSGKASLWAAIGSDVGAMLIVTINGMKLLPRKTKENDLAASGLKE